MIGKWFDEIEEIMRETGCYFEVKSGTSSLLITCKKFHRGRVYHTSKVFEKEVVTLLGFGDIHIAVHIMVAEVLKKVGGGA